MPSRDFLPQNWAAFAEWIINFYAQLVLLAAKYGIEPDTLSETKADTNWTKYWVQAKFNAKQQEKQLSEFIEATANGELGSPATTAPTWSLPDGVPDDVPPGIKKRIREIANRIKDQKSIYTLADGELLGIVTGEETGKPEADYAPTMKITQMSQYHLEFEFRKEGLDAVRFEFRRKGGAWQPVGDSAKSPTDFMITPETPGEAEQIEIRAVFLKDYQPFGSYSPIYTATVAP